MTELAKRYGGSLYDLAAEEGIEQQLLTETETAAQLMRENPDYRRLLCQPNIPKKERCALLDEAFGAQLHPYLVSFLKILCENGTLGQFDGCVRQYRARYNEAHGIMDAVAVSAVPLSEETRDRLTRKLSAMTGKTIELTVKTDPAVLGGIRLTMDGIQLDGTVQSRLDALRTELTGAVQ